MISVTKLPAHELTNLFARHYAGCGSFPSDGWANGRSPFPIYAAAQVCEKLDEQETAKWLRTVDADLDDQKLYWALHEKQLDFQLVFGVIARSLPMASCCCVVGSGKEARNGLQVPTQEVTGWSDLAVHSIRCHL